MEAIFDLRIDEIPSPAIEKIEELHSQIKIDYPNKRKKINYTGTIAFNDNLQISNETDSQIKGLIFLNADTTRQVQFRLDGFTFNMLKPYNEWALFSNEALRLWQIYNQNLKPANITRIALRYINKIQLPMPILNFQDYIVNMPPIPNCLPQTFRTFFMQTEIPCDKQGTNIIITETIERPTAEVLPFILDIDIYKTGIIVNDFTVLQAEFNSLRELKNKTFESCITDKTRKLFEKV